MDITKPCHKPQTGGYGCKCSIYFSGSKFSIQDEVGPHNLTETSMWFATDVRSCQTMAETSIIWVDSDEYDKLTTGRCCCWVDVRKFHASFRLTRAASGPGKRTGRSNRRANQCPPQRWRSEQRGCVDIQLQHTARPG